MGDTEVLTQLNDQFIEAWVKGDWALLEPILSSSFVELNGTSGEITGLQEYAESLKENPIPALVIDQVHVHVDGGSAVVSARTHWGVDGLYGRYADTYEKRDGGWSCTHATVWRLPKEE